MGDVIALRLEALLPRKLSTTVLGDKIIARLGIEERAFNTGPHET
jgi:hypothetical protein